MAWGLFSNMRHLDLNCLVMPDSSLPLVWQNYARIAHWVKRPYGLIRHIGQDCPKAPKYHLIRATGPVKQWLGGVGDRSDQPE